MDEKTKGLFAKHAESPWEGPTHLCWICVHEDVCLYLTALEEKIKAVTGSGMTVYPMVDICPHFKEKK
jgi:hypothetical protein